MTIKDVENKVGITKANIRYYEKEGLITPGRNDENNYREYSQKDVEQLERIKVLRILGIPISDIREFGAGQTTLDNVMEHRLEMIREEEKNLEAVRRVCESIRQRSLPFDAVDEDILDSDTWNDQLMRVLKEDITKEILSPKQFHANMAFMLAWGYFVNVIVAFLFGDRLLFYQADLESSSLVYIFPTVLILEAVCYFIMYFTANIKVDLLIFHLNILCLTPVLSGAYLLVKSFTEIHAPFPYILNTFLRGTHMGIFWITIIVYVILLYVLSIIWNGLFSKAYCTLGTAFAYSAFVTFIIIAMGVPAAVCLPASIGIFFFTLYISLSWFHSYQASKGRSRYFAVSEGCR